jgi:chemotaxis protein methyltransferase CheR
MIHPISDTELSLFLDFIQAKAGICIGPEKKYLVQSRLRSLMKLYECTHFSDLLNKVKKEPRNDLTDEIISAISTHETSFFRDGWPFELLSHFIKPPSGDKKQKLRIWSAACSSGQEPYSIAMRCDELGCDCEVIGTDICRKMIKTATEARYSEYEVSRGMTEKRISLYFERNADFFAVREPLRRKVTFKVMNLLKIDSRLGQFDIVYCRNIAMYFSLSARAELYRRIASHQPAGSALILGTTEIIEDPEGLYQPAYSNGCTYYLKK